MKPVLPALAAAALLAGCGERARLPDAALVGPKPTIAEPVRSLASNRATCDSALGELGPAGRGVSIPVHDKNEPKTRI